MCVVLAKILATDGLTIHPRRILGKAIDFGEPQEVMKGGGKRVSMDQKKEAVKRTTTELAKLVPKSSKGMHNVSPVLHASDWRFRRIFRPQGSSSRQ